MNSHATTSRQRCHRKGGGPRARTLSRCRLTDLHHPRHERYRLQVVIAEIGIDMSRYDTPGHLLSWACLCPRNDESAGKRRSTRLRRGGHWLEFSSSASTSRSQPVEGRCFILAPLWPLGPELGPKVRGSGEPYAAKLRSANSQLTRWSRKAVTKSGRRLR
jgi:hypothetical protein